LLRKKARQLAQLLGLLVSEVMPHYINDRLKKLSGLKSSGQLVCMPSAVKRCFVFAKAAAPALRDV
jgi:hypothetical protein